MHIVNNEGVDDMGLYLSNIVSTFQIRQFHIQSVQMGWSYPTHHHTLYEILYCRAGSSIQQIANASLAFNAGDWLFIPSGVLHATDPVLENYDFLSFNFDIDDLDFRRIANTPLQPLISKEEVALTRLPDLVDQLYRYIEDRSYQATSCWPIVFNPLTLVDKLAIESSVLAIINEILIIIDKNSQMTVDCMESSITSYELRLVDIKNTVLDLERNSSVGDIAKKLGISRTRFTKLFKKVFGISPRQYVTSLKTKRAKELLINTDESIDNISDYLGFSSASSFSRQFKRWTGLSPQHYRPRHSLKQYKNPYSTT